MREPPEPIRVRDNERPPFGPYLNRCLTPPFEIRTKSLIYIVALSKRNERRNASPHHAITIYTMVIATIMRSQRAGKEVKGQ
jgi:hypothetical protein